MKKPYLLLSVCWMFLTTIPMQGQTDGRTKPPFLADKSHAPQQGAEAYASRGDNARSPYYTNPDFYNLTSNDTLTILSHFRTMQQTTEWSCGNVAALLVLQHFNCCADENEWSLACAMRSMTDSSISHAQPGSACCFADFGTSLEALVRYFSTSDKLDVVRTSYRTDYTPEELVKEGDLYPACDYGNLYPTFVSPNVFAPWLTEQLKQNRPVLVEWSDWDGHWVVIIGIDNNGTPDFCGDDILIFADPYDTSDHWQDGYSIAPLERFFYSWKDRAIAPKPYQLQPFLVIDKKTE